MTPEVIGVLSIIFMLVLILLGVHVGLALGLSGFLGFWAVTGKLETAIGVLGMTPYVSTAQFALAVLPLFILMGAFAGQAGFAQDAYNAVQKWLGRLPGGLAITTIGANALFGAACGSSAAACAVFTKFGYPEMKRHGYEPYFACATIASAGVLAMLIPPSVLMIIYGMITDVSIGKLFLGGILPGILLSILYSILVLVWVKLNPKLAPTVSIAATWRDRLFSLFKIWGIVALIVLVLGGIYGGLFTPEEAGAAGACGALILAIFLRGLRWQEIWVILRDAAQTTAVIFLVFIGAQIYSKFLAVSMLPTRFIEWVQISGFHPILILSFFILMYSFLGCILDSISQMLITVPLLYPISQAFGWHPIWFAMVVIMSVEAGLLTPPLAIDVYVVKTVVGPEVGLWGIFRQSMLYILVIYVTIYIIIAFPIIPTWIPDHLFR